MKFKSTLTKIALEMIAPVAPIDASKNPPVKNDTDELQKQVDTDELQKQVDNLPNNHPEKLIFSKQIEAIKQKQTDEFQKQTAEIKRILSILQNPSKAPIPKLPIPENTLSPFYTMLSRAYKTLNEAGPEDLNAAQPADAAMPQPADPNAAQPAAASQPPPAPAPSPDEVDKSGETEELENDSNKIVLVGILNRVLSELLKHQNEVRANSNSEEPEKESADIRAEALTKLIDTTTSENLATSKLNELIKHIKTEFYLIYPTGKNKVKGDNSEQTKRGELINIIIGMLNELLKHQNEVVTNTATDVPSKASASRRSLALKQLIDTTTSENLATSKLNELLQYIQSQFNQIYPVS